MTPSFSQDFPPEEELLDFSQPFEVLNPDEATSSANLHPLQNVSPNTHFFGPRRPTPPDCKDPQALQTGWKDFYEECPYWSDYWVATQDASMEWPKAIKVFDGRMFWEEKLCVPMGLQKLWIRENHAALGHVGPTKLWPELRLRATFADTQTAEKFVGEVMKQCDTCQACQRPKTTKMPIVYTPHYTQNHVTCGN